MLIRHFAEQDVLPALALNNASIPDVNELDEAEARELWAMSEVALTAEVHGEFAGFCWCVPPGTTYRSLNYAWFSRRYSDFSYLDRIAVLPEHRRIGVGSEFYERLISELTGRRPVLVCEVNLRPRNEKSLLFHHRIGFREVGQQETDGGAKTVSLLELPLDGSVPQAEG